MATEAEGPQAIEVGGVPQRLHVGIAEARRSNSRGADDMHRRDALHARSIDEQREARRRRDE